jgi:ribosomal protein L11 methyltransferase
MPWLALTVQVERAAAEALSDALLEAGAQSVSLDGGMVGALLSLDSNPGSVVARAAKAVGIATPKFRVATLADQDWVRTSQAQFAPLLVGKRLWVGPTWREPPAGRIAVRIDPGLAFGTGSHASTRLVLSFLEKTICGGERVLDYGCGSGILAIAAARLGAARVDAVDLDPEAVETTRANAHANAVEVRAALPDALPAADYDVVVANILAQPLIVLAPLLAQRAKRLALSGILESQGEEVARAYRPKLEMTIADRDDGWVLLAGERCTS